MNKTLLAFGTLAAVGLAQPASAMMCGPGQQAQATQQTQQPTPQTQPQGGMCGMGQAAAQDDAFGEKSAQQRQASGMCPCCRNMMASMMRGGMGGMMGGSGGGMQHHNMPGMETDKQQ
jgi:hypothetical protein